MMDACEASLQRLGTDYIDLYLLHTVDPLVPLEETLRTLDDLVRQGKVRYVGCSNFTAWYMMKALALSDARGWERFTATQSLYALTNRDIENETIPLCLDQGVGIMVWGPLAGGFLTGKYHRNKPWPRGTRIAQPSDHLPFDEERGYRVLDTLRVVAARHETTVAQTALRYVLQKPGVSSVVFGSRTMEQMRENLRASELLLPAEDMAALDEASATPVPYPQWHYEVFNKERMNR
jgi:aryl-alcohol dehydrogenase-like predicted oxidoreductase